MDGLTRIRIFPTGMRLHEWIAFEEGFFRAERLDPEVMWDVYLGQMKGWTGASKALVGRRVERQLALSIT